MHTADEFSPPVSTTSRARLGTRQREVLRRLSGRWLLERDGEAVYWCTVFGRRVPPYIHVRFSLFSSLRDTGLLSPVSLRPGRQLYTISEDGTAALRAYPLMPQPAAYRQVLREAQIAPIHTNLTAHFGDADAV